MDASSEPDRNRQDGILAGPGGSRLCAQDFDGYARRIGRGDDRRQDAGRCDLETGARDGRSRPAGGGERSGLRSALQVLINVGSGASSTARFLLSQSGSSAEKPWEILILGSTNGSCFVECAITVPPAQGSRRLWKVGTRNSALDRSSNTGSTHSAG